MPCEKNAIAGQKSLRSGNPQAILVPLLRNPTGTILLKAFAADKIGDPCRRCWGCILEPTNRAESAFAKISQSKNLAHATDLDVGYKFLITNP
jgi:hypothetical protein